MVMQGQVTELFGLHLFYDGMGYGVELLGVHLQ